MWKPTKFHESLNEKTRNLLALMGLDRGIPAKGLIPSSLISEKVTGAKEALGAFGGPQRKAYSGMLDNLLSYLEKTMEYEDVGVHPLTKIWVHRKQPNLFHGATKRYKRKRQP